MNRCQNIDPPYRKMAPHVLYYLPFGLAKNDILALGLRMYFGAGKYIWYNGCCSSHFSASSFIEPDALDNF